jgi:hypothetical protein
MSKNINKLIAELEAVGDVQARIDRIAEDIKSGMRRYAEIDVWKLGELLGIEFDDSGDWVGHTYWAYRRNLEDHTESDRPFAENVGLLKELIPKRRYQQLAAQVDRIDADPKAKDLTLTGEEESLMREAFDEEDACDHSAFVSSQLCVESTEGAELCFTHLIGDGGECFEAFSPYDPDHDTDETAYISFE